LPEVWRKLKTCKAMKKAEIMVKLKEGYRVTHAYFSKEEYIQLVDFKLLDEKGLILNWKDFWACRRDRMFDDGWDLYHEPVNVTLTDHSKMRELAPEPEYIEEMKSTGSMPVLDWFINLFRRKTDRPRKLTKRQRMEEYDKDNEPIC
jgi:hypothetical protein